MKLSIWIALVLALAGCQRSARPDRGGQPEWYPLTSPAALGRTVAVEQVVEGSFRDRTFRLHAQLEVDNARLVLVAFTPYRSRAFMIQYADNRLELENFTSRELPFPPQMIISDIQLIFWPRRSDAGRWRVEDRPRESQRLVYRDGRLWCRIDYRGAFPLAREVALHNLAYDYRLTVRTLNPWSAP